MSVVSVPTIGENQFNLLRLLAAVQVLFVHSLDHFGYVGAGVLLLKSIPGVPVFFFISGLLISHAYWRKQQLGLRVFFCNRALRIFPALWAAVFLAAAMVFVVGFLPLSFIGTPQFLVWMAAQATVVQFYNPEFLRGFGAGVLNGALWTISVELQFYILTPLLAWLLRTRPSVFFVGFLLSLFVNVWLHFAVPGELLTKLVHVSAAPWLYMFMSGMLAAVYLPKLKAWVMRWPWFFWLALYAVAMVGVGDYKHNASNAIHPIAFIFIACIVIKAAFPERLKKGCALSFIQRNDFSYGMYLVHMPLINLLLYFGWGNIGSGVVLVFIGSCLLALLSWFYIERPALRYKV